MYKMMTAQEVIEKLWEMPEYNRQVNFTFNDLDVYPEQDIEGWYGVKLLQIFDEYYDVFAIGYWGGPGTVVYDIDLELEGGYSVDSAKQFCAKKLQKYMNDWCGCSGGCEKVCVEIEE